MFAGTLGSADAEGAGVSVDDGIEPIVFEVEFSGRAVLPGIEPPRELFEVSGVVEAGGMPSPNGAGVEGIDPGVAVGVLSRSSPPALGDATGADDSPVELFPVRALASKG